MCGVDKGGVVEVGVEAISVCRKRPPSLPDSRLRHTLWRGSNGRAFIRMPVNPNPCVTTNRAVRGRLFATRT